MGTLIRQTYAIRYMTKEPDYSQLPKQNYEWTRTVYGDVK